MRLKTIKEIEVSLPSEQLFKTLTIKDLAEDRSRIIKTLQEVAREHIKELEKYTEIKGKLSHPEGQVQWENDIYSVRHALSQILWIKNFFNLEQTKEVRKT